MTVVLGRDLTAETYAIFGGRLFASVLEHDVLDPIVDPTDPTFTTQSYACEAYAFKYEQQYIDDERVKKGDYRVVILRGSFADPATVPSPGDRIVVPPPGQTSPKRGTVMNVDLITEAQITVHVRGMAAVSSWSADFNPIEFGG